MSAAHLGVAPAYGCKLTREQGRARARIIEMQLSFGADTATIASVWKISLRHAKRIVAALPSQLALAA